MSPFLFLSLWIPNQNVQFESSPARMYKTSQNVLRSGFASWTQPTTLQWYYQGQMTQIETWIMQGSHFGNYLDTWYLIDTFSRIWYLFGQKVSIFIKKGRMNDKYVICLHNNNYNCYFIPPLAETVLRLTKIIHISWPFGPAIDL